MLHIDSGHRTSGTNEAPEFILAHPILDVVSWRVVNVQIPRSYYCVTSANNTLTLSDTSIAPATHVVTIPPGNYGAVALALALQTAFNSAGGDAHFVVTYSSSTYRLTITNGTADFTIAWGAGRNVTTNLGVVMGFDVTTDITPAVATSTGASAVNVNIDLSLQVRSQSLTAGLHMVTYDAPVRDAQLMFRVPISAAQGEVILWEPQDMFMHYLSARKVDQHIDFTLCDSYGNVIDLHGLPWRMTLEVWRD
jgi:hypothetical protein